MERKLHPNFIASVQVKDPTSFNSKPIQTHFDPTPDLNKKDTIPPVSNEIEAEILLKLNRLSHRHSTTESRLDKFIQDIHLAMSKLTSRVNDKGLQDTKIESILEKHNQTVLNFEKRMNQLLKIIEEKEAQILLLQGYIDDTRRELGRLKRI